VRIVVDSGGYDLRNVGDSALMQACVKRILDRWPNASLEVFTDDPHRLVEALPDVTPLECKGRRMFFQRWNVLGGWHHSLPGPMKARFASLEFCVRMLNPTLATKWIGWRWARRSQYAEPMYRFMDTMRKADAVVATGGGYITDEFPDHALWVIVTLRIAQKLGKPTALFGQGLGPLGDLSLRRKLLKTVRNADLVALRDGVAGSHFLDELGCPKANVVVTGDDAVEMAYKQRRQELGVYFGLNLRKAYYSSLDNKHLSCLHSVLSGLVSEFETCLVPIPISWHEEMDLDKIRNVADGLPSALWDVPGLDTPDGVIRQVGKCRLVVTGSYHAGVFALSQGVPVVGLAKSAYYQQKFLGLADQFGEGCWVVSLDSPEFRSALGKAIRDAWQRAEEIRSGLLNAAENQIERGRAAYDRFFDIVEQRRENRRGRH
jgi:polysaccharide pyruvyl transferase WcaK-like protein